MYIPKFLTNWLKRRLIQQTPLKPLQDEVRRQQEQLKGEASKLLHTADREYRLGERIKSVMQGAIGWVRSLRK